MKSLKTAKKAIKEIQRTQGEPTYILGATLGTPISSKSLRKERRIKTFKTLLSHSLDILKIGLGVAVGVGILWIIQVGVTSI